MRPFHLAIAAAGPVLAALDPHWLWAVPVGIATYGALVARASRARPVAPADPLADAGPPIAWESEARAISGSDGRALLAQLAGLDARVSTLAREAPDETRGSLLGALIQFREGARAGLELARALDRLDAALSAAPPTWARLDAAALHLRALVQRDRAASDALFDAAERRAAYANRAERLADLRARVRAEAARLIVQLDTAALSAVTIAARPAELTRVRIDASVAQETLAELAEFERDLTQARAPSERRQRR